MWYQYLIKWLVRWRFMKGIHYRCPQVVLPVSGERKAKKQDLEMGVKENVDQDEAIDQGRAVGGRVLLEVVPNRVQEGNVEGSLWSLEKFILVILMERLSAFDNQICKSNRMCLPDRGII